MTTSNDCIRLKECFLNIRNKYDKFMDKDEVGGPNDQYEKLGVKIANVSAIWYAHTFKIVFPILNEAFGYTFYFFWSHSLDIIIEDMIKCLDEHYFKVLLSKEWLTNDKIINTIIETSSDYMIDLTHLRPESLLEILIGWHNRIKVEYMKGFLQK